jgi:hypothetical protein
MRNTKFEILMFLGALVPGIATFVFAQDTTYVWQSADGDPFNIQGTIVLDSPSSANGSASDVVSLSITDTVDSYSWNPATGGGAGALYLEPVPKVAVFKFHDPHEAWRERRERVTHI